MKKKVLSLRLNAGEEMGGGIQAPRREFDNRRGGGKSMGSFGYGGTEKLESRKKLREFSYGGSKKLASVIGSAW